MPDPIQNPQPPAHDEAARAREIADLRVRAENAERDAVKAKQEVRLRSLAGEHKLDVDKVDFAAFKDEAEGQRALMKILAERNATPPPKDPIVTVTRDAGDKLLSRAEGSMLAHARLVPDGEDKKRIDAVGGARHVPMKALLRQIARAEGHHGADEWSDVEVGMWAARFINLASFHQRDASAAGKISSQFSSILANVATKAMIAGLAANNSVTWQIWATIRNVPNFLAVTNAGLASGRLTLTPEDEAFPELNQKDGGYNSQLGIYGATVSLTWQTLVNDMLGAFMDNLRRVGAIAGQTLDYQVYYALLNATWTNDVSATSPLSTIANLDKPRAALKLKKSPTADKLGIVGRFVLHDPAYALPVQQATGAIYAGGATTAPSLASRQIIPVESHWIGDTSIYASALTTDYYLSGSPEVIDTVLVNFLEGVGQTPIIMPYDPGAVAAEKYKIMLPFKATIATHSDGTNTRVTGLQKAQT